MDDPDRDRLRRLAQLQLRFCRLPGLDQSCESEARGALDAIALWTLLQEATCLLCGAQRDADFWPEVGEGKGMELGPDAGSVLCSRCRNHPNRKGEGK